MNVFIISSDQKYKYAIRLMSDIDKVKVLSTRTSNYYGDNNLSNVMSKADIIIVLIDHEFEDRKSLTHELELAVSLFYEKKPIIFPVVFDNAKVPDLLNGFIYKSCNSESEEDFIKAKQEIERIYYQIQKTKQNTNHRFLTKDYIIIDFLFSLMGFFIALIPFLKGKTFDISNTFSIVLFAIGISLALTSFILALFQVLNKTASRKTIEEKDEINDYSQRLQKAIKFDVSNNQAQNKSASPKIDALGRMLINLEDIKQFYTWSQKQAKAAFYLALSLCIAGFILISLAIILPIAFELNLQISIVSAISGSIVELIAGTALVVYRYSISQLNHYHKSLHEDERFLSSVNLLNQFDSISIRDEMLKEIINSEINMNLEELKTNNTAK